jgi:hypothetical protein
VLLYQKRKICSVDGTRVPVLAVRYRQKSIDRKSKSGLHRRMKTTTTGLTLAFCFLATAACFAADPQMGTWKLNEAKSKFTPGTGKNTRVVYEARGSQVRVTADGVNANGKATHSEWIGQLDGKDYSVTGDPNSDMRSYRKVDDRTLDFTAKKGGKVTVTGRVVVAADGKSRTVTTTGTTGTSQPTGRAWQRGDFLERQQGKKFKNIAVFEKQ